MAEKKISTIILEVDLDCSCCYKKITKTLKKFPEIQTQTFNHDKKTVTISGAFDPDRLIKCLCCKAGKSIKSYEIVKEKPKPKPDPPKKAEDPPKKPDPPKKAEDPPKKPDPPKKAEDPPKKPDPPKKDEDPPKKPDPAPKPKPDPPKPEPAVVPKPEPIPAQPAGPPPVCCRPCYEGYGGGPCWEGRGPAPCPNPVWGRPCYEGYGAGPYSSPYAPPSGSGCRFFSEEDSSCRTM